MPPTRVSAEQAAARLAPRDTLAVPLGPGQPVALLHALGERDDWEALTVFTALLVDVFRVFTKPGVQLRSGFFGPLERAWAAQGHDVQFVPADFRRFARIGEAMRPRVMATAAAPGLRAGEVSLSLHAGATVEALRACGRDPERLLVVECNTRLPRTHGLPPEHTHALALDEIDLLIETDRAPFVLGEGEPGEVEKRIAEHALAFVDDGATLQTGIGGIPNQIVTALAQGPYGDFGIHSEMFTTSLMHLHEAGKVTNRKGVYDGVSIATFAAGTLELYDWLDENPAVRFLPVDAVNAPGVIARNREMVSINGALAVDLYGQVAADTLQGAQFSGIGGHEDFTAGAGRGVHGRSLICLPSTSAGKEGPVSRIVAGLPPSMTATTPRHQVDVVVTEHGAAELAGKTVAERAEALLAVADPELREKLREEFAAFG